MYVGCWCWWLCLLLLMVMGIAVAVHHFLCFCSTHFHFTGDWESCLRAWIWTSRRSPKHHWVENPHLWHAKKDTQRPQFALSTVTHTEKHLEISEMARAKKSIMSRRNATEYRVTTTRVIDTLTQPRKNAGIEMQGNVPREHETRTPEICQVPRIKFRHCRRIS